MHSLKKNPHSEFSVGVAVDNSFAILDLRDELSKQLKASHQYSVGNLLDIEFNPIMKHTIATSGADSTVRFWDVRKLQESGRARWLLSYSALDSKLHKNQFSDQKISPVKDSSRGSVGGLRQSTLQKLNCN